MNSGNGSPSSSFSKSRHPHRHKFPSNATNQSKVSTFAQRVTPPPTTGSNYNASISDFNSSQEDAQQSSNFGVLVGTCPYMCPERERIQREKLRDLAVFERLNGNPGKSSPALAVKKFCRTISSKYVQASDMRPLAVLEDTLNYLLGLLDSKEHPFEVVHDFIFDRTRSIRQDLTMQNIVSKRVIYMYEGMVKFHVISHQKLWCSMGDPNIASLHHLNMEQLTKTLSSLFNLYEANRNSNNVHENEAEFHSLYVLLNLGSHSKPMGEPLSLWFSRVSTPILKSKEMQFARRVVRSFRLCNYIDFFRTAAAQASYLQYCIMEPYINEVRSLALSCINFSGYKLHPYPLFNLSKHLMIEESDLELLCHSCGLETCTDESGNKLLHTKQTTFSHPKGGFQKYSFLGLQDYGRQS
ncbi:SAC3 family protein C isoform X1 [Cicer arietinum]|uniref:SAC3 family protein C n=1 Tax=Cicer arietinum TaxID=3827 RepID=A0A1S2Z3C1_CICAR|nr:SAC3 family protein C [Cicer arietinum]XP_052623960.1 SAC3 family protein C [Lactuca sativa]